MLGTKQQVGQEILSPTYSSPTKNWSLPPLFPWLVVVVLTDWLITRTITRAAIHVPKPGVVLTIYQGFSLIGIVATIFATLLIFVTLGWVIWYEWQISHSYWFPLVLVSRMLLSLLFLFVVPSGWLAVLNHSLNLVAIGLIYTRILMQSKIFATAALFPTLAFLASGLYRIIPSFYQALNLPETPSFINTLFYIGEFFFVLTPFALLLIHKYDFSRRMWVVAGVPALLFSGLYIANPAMIGILVIWSTGLTLYLPWLLYAFSLWATCLIIGYSWQNNPIVGWIVILLIAGGYAPQLNTSFFLGVIALWLLSFSFEQESSL